MKKVFILGRDPETKGQEEAIRIRNEYVSSSHVKVTVENGEVSVEDLGSRNGTYVNGSEITHPTKIDPIRDILKLSNNYSIKLIELPQIKNALSTNPVSSPSAVSHSTDYAPWRNRLGGYVLDNIIITFLTTPILLLYFVIMLLAQNSLSFGDLTYIYIVSYIIYAFGALLIIHFYYAVPISRKGTTFGRKVANVKFVDLNSNNLPTVSQAWMRYFGYFFSTLILFIGFLMPLWTTHKQALHDYLAGTKVVNFE